MMLWIATTIASIFGLKDVMLILKRVQLAAIVIGFLAVCIIGGLIFKACHKAPKLDEKAIQKAQQAIAKEDRKQMLEILAQSDVAEQGIDNSVKAAENATEQAKKSYSGLSNEALASELERRLQESK